MRSKQWIKRTRKGIATCWEENLCSRRFLIVSGHGPYQYHELIIQRSNLLHLTGVETALSANEFFSRALKGTLNDCDFSISEERIINKLIPLGQCPNFLLRASRIGRGRNNRIFVSFDIALGPFPCVLLRKINKTSHVPVSLMSIHIAKFAHPIHQVRAIFWKSIEDKEPRYSREHLTCRFSGFDENIIDKDLFF